MTDLASLISKLPEHEQQKLLSQVSAYKEAVEREKAQADFMAFVKMMWPSFIHGRHHALMAKKFEEIAAGKLKRLIINMAPRHTKSEFGSFLLPAWFLGKFPEKKVIQCSNTAELAVGFGRKVRNLVGSDHYKRVFPNVDLRADSKAAGRWDTSGGGSYFAIGVGGTVTGKGADLLIIDDPHSEQEAKLAQGDPTVFDGVYEWYTSGPRQRLQPGAAIVLIMCMTGDTPVLMENGTEKPLRDIRPGDLVATFDKGKLSVSKINNWRSSGVDSIYRIQAQSGRILRANERHPFLVMNEGVLEWTRLNQLRAGDLLVSLKDVIGHLGQKQGLESAARVRQKIAIIGKAQTHRTAHWETTACGKALNAVLMGAVKMRQAVAYATTIINKSIYPNRLLAKAEDAVLSTGTASLLNSTKQWLENAITYATYAGSRQPVITPALIGTGSFASTIATKPEKSGGCSATIATLQLDTERRQAFLNELHRISDFTVDPIVSITFDGKEEVFDVEVDRTENFIANGVVSHNTRWSDKDLTGKIIRNSRHEDEWEVIELPAIMPSGNPLWPEFWSLEELLALKEELPPYKWNAQYQQTPTGEAGAIVKREWWRRWERDRPPACEFIIQSWDTAFTKGERSDYSACTTWGVFNLDEDENNVNIMLLDAFKDKWEFPELKQQALASWKEWQPDAFVIEAKAAGAPLVFELRRMGIPVSEYTPSRGNDKFARLNSVTDLFASGKVWAPDKRWADEVIEEMARFPNAEHDDLLDSSVQALIRFRQGGFLRLQSDEPEEEIGWRRKKANY
jgi:predicted phage terminase large subunit-like protein